MGGAKEQLMREMEQGWHSIADKYICPECFDDSAIQAFVADFADQSSCDYCGASSGDGTPIAAHIDLVFEFLSEAIRFEWTDPVNELPSEGGEYVFASNSMYDLIHEIPIPTENQE